ncbi:DUF2913 family protein [Edwardsiella tarda]|uniref:DUF2913 family protein n=1 Tax=Edwardsiella tarda TaxID=636 RepID=UPI000D51F8F2|nr:DUF2913 family protein [Edwardsiella tarda]UCQ27482.1 DUF2913 family protein [Edwardsiella tarda]
MKTPTVLSSPECTVADLAHFAWCALVALGIARQEGKALSPLTEHSFLVNWLVTAQKQRRFPRSIATDIESLLQLGRCKGLAAGLSHRLTCLWQDAIASAQPPSALQCLRNALAALKSQGWLNVVIDDTEWHPQRLHAEYANTSALLVKKSDLQCHFSQAGALQGDIVFQVIGDHPVVEDALRQEGLYCHLSDTPPQGMYVILTPEQENT